MYNAGTTLSVKQGDSLTLCKTQDGHVKVVHRSADFDEQMNGATRFMATYREALQELGK